MLQFSPLCEVVSASILLAGYASVGVTCHPRARDAKYPDLDIGGARQQKASIRSVSLTAATQVTSAVKITLHIFSFITCAKQSGEMNDCRHHLQPPPPASRAEYVSFDCRNSSRKLLADRTSPRQSIPASTNRSRAAIQRDSTASTRIVIFDFLSFCSH